jgi:hypothetical protein
MNKDLLFFYGLECPSCIVVEEHVDRLISEGFNIKKIEVWHDKENDEMLLRLDVGDEICGGVPFFLNQKTNKTICGEASYEEIKKLVIGK